MTTTVDTVEMTGSTTPGEPHGDELHRRQKVVVAVVVVAALATILIWGVNHMRSRGLHHRIVEQRDQRQAFVDKRRRQESTNEGYTNRIEQSRKQLKQAQDASSASTRAALKSQIAAQKSKQQRLKQNIDAQRSQVAQLKREIAGI